MAKRRTVKNQIVLLIQDCSAEITTNHRKYIKASIFLFMLLLALMLLLFLAHCMIPPLVVSLLMVFSVDLLWYLVTSSKLIHNID